MSVRMVFALRSSMVALGRTAGSSPKADAALTASEGHTASPGQCRPRTGIRPKCNTSQTGTANPTMTINLAPDHAR